LVAALGWGLHVGATLLVGTVLVVILWDLARQGWPVLGWSFLTDVPTNGMTQGGIFPAVLGTVLVTLLTTVTAVPLGVACAVYLSEYGRPGPLTALVRAAIRNLSGIPSIIYGLFGLALFAQALRLGTSLLAAGLTLGLLSLPYVITTTEEALKAVPRGMREAALALGATPFEVIRDVVLPTALPGILTGVVLTVARAAGETAPILFTGAAFYLNALAVSPRGEFMALPYHLYVLATQHSDPVAVRPLAYGTALVLVALVFVLNLAVVILRFRRSRAA
jgi:phosphate transport system permease protein